MGQTQTVQPVRERCPGGCGDPAGFHDAEWCRTQPKPTPLTIARDLESLAEAVEMFGSAHEERPRDLRLAARWLRELRQARKLIAAYRRADREPTNVDATLALVEHWRAYSRARKACR